MPVAPKEPAPGAEGAADGHPRVPGQAAASQLPGDHASRRGGLHVEGGRPRRRGARRPAMGGEGPDPCGRARQGRWREDRQHPRQDRRDRRSDAGLHVGHRADRPRGPAGEPRAGRTCLADRAGVLPLAGGGPRFAADRRDRERAGRRRHRGGRRRPTPARSTPSTSIPGVGSAGLPVPQGGDRDRAGQPHRRRSRGCSSACTGCSATGLPDARGEPLHRDRGRRAGRPGREDELRRQRVVPPGRRRGAARLRGGGPQGGRGHRPRAQLHRARRQRWAAS